jgi:ABC-type bacteriocin/lantibiotic exporter with double-glycine peptidase domain
MRLIKQRRDNDCGVAAVAMVAGVSYERALAAFTPEVQRRMTELKAGTSTRDCRLAFIELGWEPDTRVRPMRKRTLKELRGRALLCVRPPASQPKRDWHWCAFLGTAKDYHVLNPATDLDNWVVDSYLMVRKA